jgi:FMN phosphatase YigB (HAD superfamily)
MAGIIFDFNRTLYNPETGSLTDGARNMLIELVEAEHHVCLYAKKTADDRREKLKELDIEHYFSAVRFVEEKNLSDLKGFAEFLKLEPKDIYIVGDRVRSEIFLGNLLGANTIWYRQGKFASELPTRVEERPQYTITDFDELGYIIPPKVSER